MLDVEGFTEEGDDVLTEEDDDGLTDEDDEGLGVGATDDDGFVDEGFGVFATFHALYFCQIQAIDIWSYCVAYV